MKMIMMIKSVLMMMVVLVIISKLYVNQIRHDPKQLNYSLCGSVCIIMPS